ncbi:hypothetical protein F4561_005952 [Lipingzhangella halophila]|uniref:DUF4352 domain-containing protein n=1 Tax=Lipingzhangella halophila TaxID=1783352 RepID=A0A7W7RN43_9ACTN|nr:hypothetical protein [Lipingzhangella halophila]MBB4935058.1 hypothetical protein [Lipingzhangella halophila]
MTPPHRSLPRLLLTAALSVLLLALIGVTRAYHVEFDQRVAPIAYSGDASEVVDASRFTLEVDEVRFGHDIAGGDFEPLTGTEADPDYVWMVITVTIEATKESMAIHDPVRLECGDTSYAGRVSSPLPSGGLGASPLQAGIPVTGSLAFELPPEKIIDPTLRVTAVSAGAAVDDRLSSEAVVDLGLRDEELSTRIDEAAETVEVTGGDQSGGLADERRAPAEPTGEKDGATND